MGAMIPFQIGHAFGMIQIGHAMCKGELDDQDEQGSTLVGSRVSVCPERVLHNVYTMI